MNETLESLRSFAARLAAATAGIAEADLRRLERDGGWSVLDVVSHLGDLELVYAVRMRDLLAGSGERTLQPLAQDEWVQHVHRREEPLAELLEEFRFHRRMNLALIERLSPAELDRTGVHPQYGALSIRDVAGRLLRHDAKHLGQIERIKTALGIGTTPTP
jgi:hypothetical protein